MGNIGNAKILGGVGAILMLIGGFATGFLSLVGFILVLIAVKYISDDIKDKSIFSNFLLFVVVNIIAVVALAAAAFIALGTMGFSPFSTVEITNPTAIFDNIGTFLVICIAGFVVFYILNIIGALFLKKSFDSITQHTKVDMFKTAAFIYLIGAFLLIIGIGFLVLFIAQILMIVAFFSLPDNLSQIGTPGGASTQTGRVCPNCGRPIPMDANVCPYCGKKFDQI